MIHHHKMRRAGAELHDGTLYSVLDYLGLTTGLKVSLDAGDSTSYSSGQTWYDTSGNDEDFYFGTDGTVQSSDPTFNGVAGDLSINEYMSTDGADTFKMVNALPAWLNTIHKDNAAYSIVMFYYAMSSAGEQSILSNYGVIDADDGWAFRLNNNYPNIYVSKSGSATLNKTGDTTANANAWNMMGVSVDEATGAGGGFHYLNGSYNQVSASNTFNATYSSPSTNSSDQLRMFQNTDTGHKCVSGSRLAILGIWQGTVLTKANMDSIWTELGGRFSL